jgi:hypothetical protein
VAARSTEGEPTRVDHWLPEVEELRRPLPGMAAARQPDSSMPPNRSSSLVGIAGQKIVRTDDSEPAGVATQRDQRRPLSAQPADCGIPVPRTIDGIEHELMRRTSLAASLTEKAAPGT